MSVPQPSGGCPDVNPGAGQHGGGEVAQIMEPDRSETEAFRCPSPMARHLVRSHRAGSVECWRPHVPVNRDPYARQI
jgi:hypothetical protein